MNSLLDYFFPITIIEPTPSVSTAFLKQACLVVKPKSGQEGNVGRIFECSSMTAVSARTDNDEAQQLFDAGLSKVYILLSNDLDLEDALDGAGSQFFTLLISSDFVDADFDDSGDAAVSATIVIGDLTFTALPGVDGNDLSIELLNDVSAGEETAHLVGDKITIKIQSGTSTATQIKAAFDDSVSIADRGVTCAIAMGQGAVAQTAAAEDDFAGGIDSTIAGLLPGTFVGVIGVSSDDTTFLGEQAAIANRCAFYSDSNGAKNLCYAFGKLLSNSLNWLNQQYITMPFSDSVETKGDADSMFDDKISFVFSDGELGDRLALFAQGGKAIVAPYIKRNLQIDEQSAALSYISANQPQYTKVQAALLEDELQQVVQSYIDRQWIEAGTVQVILEQSNFIASGYINIAEPSALWRIFGEMRQTL